MQEDLVWHYALVSELQQGAARNAVTSAWDEGCPVAGGEPGAIAAVAVRRWNSRERRLTKDAAFELSVEDLAKGLIEQMEPDRDSVGSLIEDYRFLARRLAAAMSGSDPQPQDGSTTSSIESAQSNSSEPGPTLIVAGCVFPHLSPDVVREWTGAVYAMARAAGARVMSDVEPVHVGRSFARVVLELRSSDRITLLMNPATRTVAAVDGECPFIPNAHFVDVPASEAFSDAGFNVALAVELEAPIDGAELHVLSDYERSQVHYHGPVRRGNVPFNWFD